MTASPHLLAAPASASDSELVGSVRRGDGAAFAEIMRRNNRRLFRLARGVLRDDAEAEEVVQETYVRAYAGLGTWRGAASLSTWLSRIAINEAVARLRRRHPTVDLEVLDAAGSATPIPFLMVASTSPEDGAARAEIRRLIEHAVDDLPPAFRTVFMLRAVEQLAIEDIAATLAIPEATVRTRFFRARRLLRRSLGERLASALDDAFPFAGARCERIMLRVLDRLGIAASAPSARLDPP